MYRFCAAVPYGIGPGAGAATLPGAKPLKPPGVCLYACVSALKNKPLHPSDFLLGCFYERT